MSREETIKWLKYIKDMYSWSVNCDKSLDMAIKALNMWDNIIDELEKELKEYDNVITDLDYATGVGYALDVIKEYKKGIEE